jgi:hypothetical protein
LKLKIVYTYNPDLKNVFSGLHVCQVDPRSRGKRGYLYPSFYSEQPPCADPGPFKSYFYNETKKKWEIGSDFRGLQVYEKATGYLFVCDSLDIPEEFTTEEPWPRQKWGGESWVDDNELVEKYEIEEAKKEVLDLDAKSISIIRKWICERADCPEELKAIEEKIKGKMDKIK